MIFLLKQIYAWLHNHQIRQGPVVEVETWIKEQNAGMNMKERQQHTQDWFWACTQPMTDVVTK